MDVTTISEDLRSLSRLDKLDFTPFATGGKIDDRNDEHEQGISECNVVADCIPLALPQEMQTDHC